MALKLHWGNCQGDVWCNLDSVNLDHPIFSDLYGVYIIWYKETTIKVGYGFIKAELMSDRTNPQINIYNSAKVTWARAAPLNALGARNFIANRLNPIVSDNLNPHTSTEEVNFPWW